MIERKRRLRQSAVRGTKGSDVKTGVIALASRPVGLPKNEDFAVREIDLPEPGDGEVLVENVCMSVDPYMRAHDRPQVLGRLP